MRAALPRIFCHLLDARPALKSKWAPEEHGVDGGDEQSEKADDLSKIDSSEKPESEDEADHCEVSESMDVLFL